MDIRVRICIRNNDYKVYDTMIRNFISIPVVGHELYFNNEILKVTKVMHIWEKDSAFDIFLECEN